MDQVKVNKKNQMTDGPLRIDHSEVYFENDRLSEELGIVTDILLKYKHRQYLSRDNEIKELRRNLGCFEAMKKFSHHTHFQKRPQTTPAYLTRQDSLASQVRLVKLSVRIPDDDSDNSSDRDSDLSSLREKAACISKAKGPMMTKAEVMKKQLQHRKYPQSWYTDVLEPSDTAIQRSLPRFPSDFGHGRSRSASYGNRAKRKQSSSMLPRRSVIPEVTDDNPTLVCSRAKSAVLSRRKLKQMINVDHITEPEEKIEPVQALREINRIQNERLQVRIKMFLDSLEDVKKRREASRLARKARRMTAVYGTETVWFNDSVEPSW